MRAKDLLATSDKSLIEFSSTHAASHVLKPALSCGHDENQFKLASINQTWLFVLGCKVFRKVTLNSLACVNEMMPDVPVNFWVLKAHGQALDVNILNHCEVLQSNIFTILYVILVPSHEEMQLEDVFTCVSQKGLLSDFIRVLNPL